MVKNITKRYRIQESKFTLNKKTFNENENKMTEVLLKNNKNNKRQKTVTANVVSDNNNIINTKDNE
jgi:hypothetical protein